MNTWICDSELVGLLALRDAHTVVENCCEGGDKLADRWHSQLCADRRAVLEDFDEKVAGHVRALKASLAEGVAGLKEAKPVATEDYAATISRMHDALVELRDRITGHPAYAELTEEEEMEVGGDTAELSYLARVAAKGLGHLPDVTDER